MISSQLFFNFTINQFPLVNILSLFNDTLLVGSSGQTQFFIYSHTGRNLLKITDGDKAQICDATWTPRGNILYATKKPYKVVVMSQNGTIIAICRNMKELSYFSVSSDNGIFVIENGEHIFYSVDDGISWRLQLRLPHGWLCWQVIGVINGRNKQFWMLGHDDKARYNLAVYGTRLYGEALWRNVNLTLTESNHVYLVRSSLSYDGNMTIFLNDFFNKALHVFSVSGLYRYKLLSPRSIKNNPCRLAIDNKRQLLYVGQENGLVEVFMLLYWHYATKEIDWILCINLKFGRYNITVFVVNQWLMLHVQILR